MADSNPVESDVDRAIVDRLRTGIRQRRSEIAGRRELQAFGGPPDVESRAVLEEPIPVSARATTGRLIVLARKFVYHAFVKWYSRPLIQQQTRFNLAASRRIRELLEIEARVDSKLAELEALLADLDRRSR